MSFETACVSARPIYDTKSFEERDLRKLEVRAAKVSEAELITRLINLAFQVERFAIEGDRTNVDQVVGWFETGTFLVAEHAAELMGCVYVERRGSGAYLGLLSVESSRQGQGLGPVLMAAAEEYCSAIGCRFVELRIVSAREGLPSFYRRLGYLETGTTPVPDIIPARVPFHFIHMSKQLEKQ